MAESSTSLIGTGRPSSIDFVPASTPVTAQRPSSPRFLDCYYLQLYGLI
jgi:hypothetical protein